MIRAIFAALGLLLCSGCVNYEQETYLSEDLSGRVELRFSVDSREGFRVMSREMKGTPAMKQLMDQIADGAAIKLRVNVTEENFLDMFNVGAIKRKEYRKVEEKGTSRFYFTAEFDDIRKLYEGKKTVTVAKAEDGRVTYTEYFEPLEDAKKDEKAAGNKSDAFRGFLFKYVLHMPQDIASANTDRIDKDTATWERPLDAAMGNKDFFITATMGSQKHHPLLDQAKREDGERVDYALRNGVRVELTPDGRSFYLLWYPENPAGGALRSHPPMIVTIHGHGSWAFDEFYLWHQAARERGYGILAIQWWLGQGERFQDYLTPQEIYRVVDQALTHEGAATQTALFHGFSRGSTNTCAVAAMDRSAGKDYFALIVANAGKPGPDFPPNRDIEEGRFGAMPLEGTHWVTFAGGRDPHPDRDGIAGMREAAAFIRKYGGVVDLAIEDPNADHGGFHRNPVNMNAALEAFERRLAGID